MKMYVQGQTLNPGLPPRASQTSVLHLSMTAGILQSSTALLHEVKAARQCGVNQAHNLL